MSSNNPRHHGMPPTIDGFDGTMPPTLGMRVHEAIRRFQRRWSHLRDFQMEFSDFLIAQMNIVLVHVDKLEERLQNSHAALRQSIAAEERRGLVELRDSLKIRELREQIEFLGRHRFYYDHLQRVLSWQRTFASQAASGISTDEESYVQTRQHHLADLQRNFQEALDNNATSWTARHSELLSQRQLLESRLAAAVDRQVFQNMEHSHNQSGEPGSDIPWPEDPREEIWRNILQDITIQNTEIVPQQQLNSVGLAEGPFAFEQHQTPAQEVGTPFAFEQHQIPAQEVGTPLAFEQQQTSEEHSSEREDTHSLPSVQYQSPEVLPRPDRTLSEVRVDDIVNESLERRFIIREPTPDRANVANVQDSSNVAGYRVEDRPDVLERNLMARLAGTPSRRPVSHRHRNPAWNFLVYEDPDCHEESSGQPQVTPSQHQTAPSQPQAYTPIIVIPRSLRETPNRQNRPLLATPSRSPITPSRVRLPESSTMTGAEVRSNIVNIHRALGNSGFSQRRPLGNIYDEARKDDILEIMAEQFKMAQAKAKNPRKRKFEALEEIRVRKRVVEISSQLRRSSDERPAKRRKLMDTRGEEDDEWYAPKVFPGFLLILVDFDIRTEPAGG